MRLINQFLNNVKTELVAADATRVGSWWNFKNLNSPFSRLYLVTDGQGYVTHHGKTHELSAGTLHLVPRFTFHSIECEDYMNHFFLHFFFEISSGIEIFKMNAYDYNIKLENYDMYLALFKRLIDLNPDRGIIDLNDMYANYYQRIYNSDYKIKDEECLANSIESDGIIKFLIAPILRTQKETDSHLEDFDKAFVEIFEYIDKNIERTIHIDELAEIIYLNPTYFSDRFQKVMGMRPTQYIMKRRVEMAQIMLMDSDKSLSEIAYATGFCDLPHFSKTFTKRLGGNAC